MYIKHIYKNEKNAKASLTIEIVCKPPAAASAPQKNKLIIVFYKCFDWKASNCRLREECICIYVIMSFIVGQE